jgi:NAD(P)H dehydrogenase (quinone)
MNVLIVSCNPAISSFDRALAVAYYEGAISTGASVHLLELSSLEFDPILHKGYKVPQPLEQDLVRAQDLIKNANHIVFVYPSWWGSMPALLKGFIDRVFLPGFAFKYHPNDILWDKYLKGKTARIILTMDAPGIWNRIMYHRSNIYALKVATLQFCGIRPVHVTTFSRIRFSTHKNRMKWLDRVKNLGKAIR